MLEVLEDVTGGSEVRAFDDVQQLDDIRVIKLLEDVILSLDFGGLDGHKHFDRHLLFGFYIAALEDVRVLTTTQLMRDRIVLQIAE
jgi:hypothetical protein